MPSYLTVHRPNAWVGRAVARRIHINGQLAGKVKNGSSAAFPVHPGVYRVTVGGGSSRSEEVVVSVADHTYVNLVTTPNNQATIINGIVGGCFGVGIVAFHRDLAYLIIALALVTMATWAVGRTRPGLFVRLRTADSGPLPPTPYYQPPQAPNMPQP